MQFFNSHRKFKMFKQKQEKEIRHKGKKRKQ